MAFDPDAYLAAASPATATLEPPGFDPDAYLAARPVRQGAVRNFANAALRGIGEGIQATADALYTEDLNEFADTDRQIEQELIPRRGREGPLSGREENILSAYYSRQDRRNANAGLTPQQIEQRRLASRQASNEAMLPVREGLSGTLGNLSGRMASVLGVGPAAPLAGGLQQAGEAESAARLRGEDTLSANEAFARNLAVGTAVNAVPIPFAKRVGAGVDAALANFAPGALRDLAGRGATALGLGASNALLNTGVDAGLQLADTGDVDLERLGLNAALSFGSGASIGALTPRGSRAPRDIELDVPRAGAPEVPVARSSDIPPVLALENTPAPAARAVLDGPSVPAVADDLIIEPLGKRYLVLEGVGEPVEQFQVRRRGDPRGITLDRAGLEARGLAVMDAPQIDTPSTPPLEILDSAEALIPQQVQAMTGGGGPPNTPNAQAVSGAGGVPPSGASALVPANAGGPPAIPPSGIVPVPPGPPPSNNPIPRSIYDGPAEAVWGELKRKLVDFAAPIEDSLRKFERKYGFTIDPNSRISNYIDRAIRAPKLAGQFVKDSGLQGVIQSVDNIDDFGTYLADLHTLDLVANGKRTGRDLQAAAQNVKAKAPLYAKAQQQVKSASDALLGLSVNYGLISPELAQHLNDIYPNYVPFQRVFDVLEKEESSGGRRAVASLSRQDVFRKFEGSDRPVENPLGSILKKVEDVFVQGERNLAGRTLAEYRNLPGFNEIIRELPPGRSAKNTFSFLDEGEKRTFEVPKEIADAAKNLNSQQLGIVMSALSLPVRVFKLGTTGINPVFAAKNIIRDLWSTIVQSPNTYAAMTAMPRALFEAVGHGDLYDQVNRAGGMQTSYDLLRNEPMQTVERIRSGRSVPSKIKYLIDNPLKAPGEMIRAIEDTVGRTEEFGRIQNFIAGFEDAVKQGLPPEEAITQGARYARETTANFARKGEYGSVINALWPYFNANIQGVRGFVRALRRAPAETAIKWGVAVATPVTAAVLWNLWDEKRREAWEDIPEYEKENNIIVLPPDPQKDEKGRWNAIRIPLQPGIGKATSLIRRPLEALNGQDPVAFAEMARAFLAPVTPIDPEGGTLASNATPLIARPLLEARLNKNFYTSQPIVPERLLNLVPELQYTKNTSRAAIQLGELLGASPMNVDHVLRGYGGEVASNLVNAYDRFPTGDLGDALAGTSTEGRVGGRSIPEGFDRAFTTAAGGNVSRKFYEALTAAEQARESYRQMLVSGQVLQADKFLRENEALINAAPALGSLRRAISNVTRMERTDGVDAEYQKTLREQREAIVRQGVETLRDLEAAQAGKK